MKINSVPKIEDNEMSALISLSSKIRVHWMTKDTMRECIITVFVLI